MYECSAYIPDMSGEDSKRALHRQRQARYEAHLRDGIGPFPTPVRASEIAQLPPDAVIPSQHQPFQ